MAAGQCSVVVGECYNRWRPVLQQLESVTIVSNKLAAFHRPERQSTTCHVRPMA